MKFAPDRVSELLPVKPYSPKLLGGAFALFLLVSPAGCTRPLNPGLGWPFVYQEGFTIPFFTTSETYPLNFVLDYLVAYAIVVVGVWLFYRV